MFYVKDLIAQRYSLAPWDIDESDVRVRLGLRRARQIMNLEAERAEQLNKRMSKRHPRLGAR